MPRNGRFLYSAVTQYPPARMMEFLEAEGCPLKTERGNRVFPVSDSSASVQQALERALGRAGVTVRPKPGYWRSGRMQGRWPAFGQTRSRSRPGR